MNSKYIKTLHNYHINSYLPIWIQTKQSNTETYFLFFKRIDPFKETNFNIETNSSKINKTHARNLTNKSKLPQQNRNRIPTTATRELPITNLFRFAFRTLRNSSSRCHLFHRIVPKENIYKKENSDCVFALMSQQIAIFACWINYSKLACAETYVIFNALLLLLLFSWRLPFIFNIDRLYFVSDRRGRPMNIGMNGCATVVRKHTAYALL